MQEAKAAMRERKKELTSERTENEKQFVKGRWVSDNNAMQHSEIRKQELVRRNAPKRLAKMGVMKIEESQGFMETEKGEVSDRISQQDLVNAVDIQTQRKKFELTLDKLGPYIIDYTKNGSHVVLCGLRGHLASFNWKNFALQGETQLKDKCTDVKYLVDHSMMAVAQKKFVYMYSKEGVEMHVLNNMANMDRLEFLPRHMLLAATSSVYSTMGYMDISTGQTVATKTPAIVKDPTTCLKANPSNAVISTCDLRGIVKFWSPTVADPLVQLKAHKGPIQDIAFHSNGRYFVTLGGDHKMKVWDTRALRTLEEYAVTYCFDTIDISYSGLVAMGGGTNVHVWKDLFTQSKPSGPYMKHGLGYGNIASRVRFCPFEDVLGIGHSKGFSSIIIPGSGEANPDFFYANPHETERHRKDRVVTSLLDKLAPDTISMDLKVHGVDEKRLETYNQSLAAMRKARNIREKKYKRPDTSAPVSNTGLVGHDDEIDEDLGFVEEGPARQILSKKELQKQKKMDRWDKKDTADKIRSKQTMRHSKIVQQQRRRIEYNKKKEAAEGPKKPSARTPSADAEAEPSSKRSRAEVEPNAALRRFL